MFQVLWRAREKLSRDSHLPLSTRMAKAVRYTGEILLAPLHLHAVNELGSGVRTLGRPRIDNQGRISIGSGSLLRSINVPVELATGPNAEIVIGSEVRLNYGVSIGAMGSIRIGDRTRIGPYVMIIDTEFHDAYDRTKRPDPRPVVIEEDVWIGAKASIMPGVTIGRGAIVGVSAVVTANVPPYTVVGGVPAREIRKLDPGRFGKG
jgi:acetyltransferase-like isoleucine patch superfamily enzyme